MHDDGRPSNYTVDQVVDMALRHGMENLAAHRTIAELRAELTSAWAALAACLRATPGNTITVPERDLATVDVAAGFSVWRDEAARCTVFRYSPPPAPDTD